MKAGVMASDIYIQVKAKSYGPFDESEFKSAVEEGRIPFACWVYRSGEWKLLAEMTELRRSHPDYSEMPKTTPTSARSKDLNELNTQQLASVASISAEPVWFVIREKKKYGPFAAAEIVSQLQNKKLDAAAFVWRPGFSTWQKISQVNEFSKDNMKRLVKDSAGVDVIMKRKHKRAAYDVEVIAHDNTRAIEGKSMMIGEGGLFMSTPKPTHAVGSRLKLHFREGDSPAFNAVAEVVSVVRDPQPGYCMRFVAISDTDRRRIAKYVSTKES